MATIFYLARGRRDDAADLAISRNHKGEVVVAMSSGRDHSLLQGQLSTKQAREAGQALIAAADAIDAEAPSPRNVRVTCVAPTTPPKVLRQV